MTKNAPDDIAELQATAENPPTPDSNPRTNMPDDPMRLQRRELNDSRMGNNGNKHRTDGGSRDVEPGVEGRTNLLKTLLDRPEEVHALVVGVAAGALAAQGDFNAVAAIVGAGALGSRMQIGLPEKYLQQAKAEAPYAIAGIAIGYAFVRFGPQLSGIGV